MGQQAPGAAMMGGAGSGYNVVKRDNLKHVEDSSSSDSSDSSGKCMCILIKMFRSIRSDLFQKSEILQMEYRYPFF